MQLRYFILLPLLFATVYLAAAPVAVCRAYVNVALPNNACEITLTPAMIDGGSYDTNGSSFSLSLSNHRDLAPGYHDVFLYVVTRSSSAVCVSRVLVEDKTTPVLVCNDQVQFLFEPDQPVIFDVETMITVTDNCPTTLSTDISVFDYGEYGSQPFSASATDVGGNTGHCSGTLTINDAEPQNYCPAVRNDYYEHIARLQLSTASGTVTANTGPSGGYDWHYPLNSYSNVLYHGSTYSLHYQPGFRFASSYREYWRVYLDKNADGDFTDRGELLHQWNGYGGNSFNFTSPGTVWGWSRIRVVMSYGGYAPPCGGGYGETEDISVYLRPYFFFPWPGFRAAEVISEQLTAAAQTLEPALERPDDPIQPNEDADRPRLTAPDAAQTTTTTTPPTNLRIFPNPVRAGQELTVSGLPADEALLLRNLTGQVVTTFPAGNTRLSVPAKLPAGIYLLSGNGWTRRVVVR